MQGMIPALTKDRMVLLSDFLFIFAENQRYEKVYYSRADIGVCEL